jgi:hypothetical protein
VVVVKVSAGLLGPLGQDELQLQQQTALT